MASKTVRRDWIKRQIEKGIVEVKCNYKYTDDYAFDAAVKFQKTDWMPARVDENRRGQENGCINFHPEDFRFQSGLAYRQDDGTIRFVVMAGESYTLRMTA